MTDSGLPPNRTRTVPPLKKRRRRKLTAAERAKLASSEFALQAQRRYPIPDRYHAELALRDMKHESLATQTRIRQAIRKRFPNLI